MITGKDFKYQESINVLRNLKRKQTEEKIIVEGLFDEDDYGRVIPPKGHWNSIPNNPDGSFYGLAGWTNNFCDLLAYP